MHRPDMIGQAASTKIPPEPAPLSGETSPPEIGGRDGPEPTRFGDWEKNGRCIDF
jgi:hypothetical protein